MYNFNNSQAITAPRTDTSPTKTEPITKRSLPTLAATLDEWQMIQAFTPIIAARKRDRVQIDHIGIEIIQCRSKRCVTRYTIRLADGSHANMIGKVYRPNRGQAVFDYMCDLWKLGFDYQTDDDLHIPEPVAFIPSLNMLLQDEVPGHTVKEHIRRDGSPHYMRQLARGLAKLHRSGYKPGKFFHVENHLMRCHPKYQVLSMAVPELAGEIEYIAQSAWDIESKLDLDDFATIHGDFHLSQMMIEGDQSWLLDFDPLSFGDPAADLGNLLVLLKGKSRKWGNTPLLIDTFLEEYFKLMPDKIASRIPLYESMTYLRRACKKLRFQQPGWQQTVHKLIPQGVACIQQAQVNIG